MPRLPQSRVRHSIRAFVPAGNVAGFFCFASVLLAMLLGVFVLSLKNILVIGASELVVGAVKVRNWPS